MRHAGQDPSAGEQPGAAAAGEIVALEFRDPDGEARVGRLGQQFLDGDGAEDAVERRGNELTVALGVTLTDDGQPLDGTAGLLLTPRTGPEPAIAVGPRIGVGKARDFPLRFWVAGDPTVSRPR